MDFTTEAYVTMMNDTIDIGPTKASNPGWSVSDIENSTFVRIIYGIITLVGLVGNFLVCFTLIRIPALRSRTSHFIIHLAITDMMTLTWVIPFHLFPYVPSLPQQPGYDALCRLFFSKFPLWSTIFSSAYSLLLVTSERFVAIVFPIKYKTIFSKRNSAFMMAACWFIGIISNVYNFRIFGLRDGVCGVEWPNDHYQRFIGFYTIIAVYLFPISFMLFAHYKMISILKHRVKEIDAKRTGTVLSKTIKKESWQLKAAGQLISTLLWVVITYAICWAPNQFIFFAYNMGAPVDFSQVYYHVSVIFAICNSCLNPIIYSLKNKPYRVGLKEALRWGKLSRITKSASRLAGVHGISTDSSAGAIPIVHIDGTNNTPLSSMVRTPKGSPRPSPKGSPRASPIPSPKGSPRSSLRGSPTFQPKSSTKVLVNHSNGYDVANQI